MLAYTISLRIASLLETGKAYERDPFAAAGYFMLLVIIVYAWFLLARRLRYMPVGLQHAKFVKLSYLRKMHRQGHHIARFQDLPAEAFGDAHKSLWLIITSHRWLDRYTCDVATDEYPSGLRLSTMLERLNGYFSPQGFGQGKGLRDRFRRLRASLSSGGDVLIFFDFMCIPQVGKDDNGDPIPRTYLEEKIFQQILPSMPTLYSTFDVCVLPAVIEGAVPYEESGWCFCERVVASLGGRLQFFSPEYDLMTPGTVARVQSDDVAECLQQLQTKHFLNDSDRHVVRTLVKDYKLKRTFHDAIFNNDADKLRSLLDSLQGRRKFVMINSFIDCHLNTPLHLAVTMRSVEMTELLLQHGAWRSSRNVHGDRPTQFLMLPRISWAAMLCRRVPGRDSPDDFEDCVSGSSAPSASQDPAAFSVPVTFE